MHLEKRLQRSTSFTRQSTRPVLMFACVGVSGGV